MGYTEPLPFQERYYPAGFPLLLRTNSRDILTAAEHGWGEFRPLYETTPIELRVLVRRDGAEPPPAAGDGPIYRAAGSSASPDRHGAGTPPAGEGPVYRAQGHLLALVLGAENFALCDLDRGFGFAWLSPGVAQQHLYTGFHFLDGMAYTCLCHRYLTPIHAACVAYHGAGLLLVGDSGAGKSSLAWASARAGLTYVCDDAAWLLRDGVEPTIIGKSQRLRFRPDIFEILPELEALPRLETVPGKRSFEIRTAGVPGLATAARCRPA
ncbi:MAG TPA: hypothetical protein VI410_06530, partial [Anaerolineales bacterium]|nr:hypothetical protein [Anaerolineales bacterium]